MYSMNGSCPVYVGSDISRCQLFFAAECLFTVIHNNGLPTIFLLYKPNFDAITRKIRLCSLYCSLLFDCINPHSLLSTTELIHREY